MDRQVSYNGPLVISPPVPKSQSSTIPSHPLPRGFPSSPSSGTMNHPLPPKPPVSKYYVHAYVPHVRDPGIFPGNSTARQIDRGSVFIWLQKPSAMIQGQRHLPNDMSFASHSSKNNIFAELKWLKQIDELLID